MSPKAQKRYSAAADEVQRVGALADCTLVAADGSSYKVSKAITAVHSRRLGCMYIVYLQHMQPMLTRAVGCAAALRAGDIRAT
jgi:hypothetical protein